MTRLLLVEDDAKLVRALRRGLEREGYAVDPAGTGDEALGMLAVSQYDAVVLDVMLPGTDGFAVCEALRAEGRGTPVLMLTARTDIADRIRGLDAGADDYLVKPFDFGELLARLRALTRRGPLEPPPPLRVGGLEFDPERLVVTRDGRPVQLTAREFAVLEVLAQHAGTAVPRATLLERVWDDDGDVSPNIVDVYVGYLRRKLERSRRRRLIRTVRGVGFLLETE
ncbi:MAG TPA: response regulator transcription factor [Solirubrobacteraceae bacterium]|nr:response regulator transcription factor [Solirubrobacteraceae bacterium]HSD79010.1 response regulator transcription factor [Solirubrobacteraceae bacterium]